MKFFHPYLFAAMNLHRHSNASHCRECPDFWTYLDTTLQTVWEKNHSDYQEWIESSSHKNLIQTWYNDFQLHDETFHQASCDRTAPPPWENCKVVLSVGKSKAEIECAYFEAKAGTMPDWSKSSDCLFLYDEFSEDDGRLIYEFYTSDGRYYRFVGVKAIRKLS